MTNESAWSRLCQSVEGRPVGVSRRFVWPTGQQTLSIQLRASGCVADTKAEVDLIPPAIATYAITTYTDPGELVLDLGCVTGTVRTPAPGVHRIALGLTADLHWWATDRGNITRAKRDGARCEGSALGARPAVLATVRASKLAGRVALVLTALRTTGHDLGPVFDDLATTLRHCRPLLRSGGHVVVAARWQRHLDRSLVDLSTQVIAAGASANLVAIDQRTHGVDHEVFVFRTAADAESTSSVVDGPPPSRAIRFRSNSVEDVIERRAA
ncbi:hypothetical protein ACFYOT_25275 [Saccharothrix saharensis]|uniref:hypothetical protein n=1 Tax=Saccharothrix saharensis TaxID=571190 RepID=UPI0036BB8DC3